MMSVGDPVQTTPTPILPSRDYTQLTAIVMIVSAIAWLAVFLLHGHSGHTTLDANGLTGWCLMVVAMMLPPLLPFLYAMVRLTGDLAAGRSLVATATVSYLVAWILVGVLLLASEQLWQTTIVPMPWIAQHPILLNGLAAIFAGLYQLSSLKHACLTACRSPIALLMIAWEEDQPWRSAIIVGLRYGLVCIGCCWALMLLTLVVGAFALPLMVFVSIMMLLERILPSVRSLIPIQAAIACGIGILLLLGAFPLEGTLESAVVPIHHTH